MKITRRNTAKKIIHNPSYEKAEYELGFIVNGKMDLGFDPSHHRFNSLPEESVYNDKDRFYQWVIDNSIPKFIEIDEENNPKS